MWHLVRTPRSKNKGRNCKWKRVSPTNEAWQTYKRPRWQVKRYRSPHDWSFRQNQPQLLLIINREPQWPFNVIISDGIPGVVPGLVPGIQGCKSPGSLGKTWDQAKSLKFILIDSNFLLSPVLRHPVTLGVSPVFSKKFSFFKKIFFEEHPLGLPRVREVWEGAQRVPLACPEL